MKKKTTEEFCNEVEEKYPGKWLLDKVEYKSYNTKVKIGCKKHGYFEIRPSDILRGQGCSICYGNKTKTTEEFCNEVEEKFGDKWLLDKVEYVNAKTKVKIGCKKHGYFEIVPSSILGGHGCPVCGGSQTRTTEEFCNEVEEKYPGKWLLDKVEYVNNKTKVKIGCKKHGYWEIVPSSILNGRGCPVCNESKGEKLIAQILDAHEIKYVRQKKFTTCRNKNPLPFDFYLPQFNILIEYDGRQHFVPVKRFGGEEGLKRILYHDMIKTKWAKENGIKLFRFDYLDDNDFIHMYLGRIIKFNLHKYL